MNKQELIDAVAEKVDRPKKHISDVLDGILDVIQDEVASGGKVMIVGFGAFDRGYYQAREGRNPKTGEPIQIGSRYSPRFSGGKAFKDKVEKAAK